MRPVFTEPAIRDLARLDGAVRTRIAAAIDRMSAEPGAADLKKVRGQPGIWRLRVGNWRISLEPHWADNIIYILRVKHRREAYR